MLRILVTLAGLAIVCPHVALGARVSLNELMSLEPVNPSEPPAGSIHYHNPRDGDDRCGIPLTANEKIAQQRGDAFPERDIGNRPARGDLFVFGESLLSQNLRAKFKAVLLHPKFILHFNTILRTRDRAWEIEEREFPSPKFTGGDDEADAFRHFVFVGLLYFTLGPRLTEKALIAHEYYQVHMSSIMDRYNNKTALEYMAAYGHELSQLSREELERRLIAEGRELLKSGDLVVLRRRVRQTPQPSVDFYRFAHRILEEPL